jgi:hypothetical protein
VPYLAWEWTDTRRVRLTEHAQTLVVSGPASSLLQLGDLVTQAGELVVRSREVHRHGEAYLVGLTDVVTGGAGPLEFDVVGRDPLFHSRAQVRRPWPPLPRAPRPEAAQRLRRRWITPNRATPSA